MTGVFVISVSGVGVPAPLEALPGSYSLLKAIAMFCKSHNEHTVHCARFQSRTLITACLQPVTCAACNAQGSASLSPRSWGPSQRVPPKRHLVPGAPSCWCLGTGCCGVSGWEGGPQPAAWGSAPPSRCSSGCGAPEHGQRRDLAQLRVSWEGGREGRAVDLRPEGAGGAGQVLVGISRETRLT